MRAVAGLSSGMRLQYNESVEDNGVTRKLWLVRHAFLLAGHFE